MTISEIKQQVSCKQVFQDLMPTYQEGSNLLSKACPCGRKNGSSKEHHCSLNDDKFVKCFVGDCGKTFDQIGLYEEIKVLSPSEAKRALEIDYGLNGYGFKMEIIAPKETTPKEVLFLEQKEVNELLSKQDSPFHKFCIELGITANHLKKWNVGGSVWRDKSGTEKYKTYFLEEFEGNFYNFQYILYNDNGKRIEGNEGSKTQPKEGDSKYSHVLYGLHLFDITKPVFIVEGNKTAVICSFFYPEYNFLACQGSTGLSADKLSMLLSLNPMSIYWLADADDAGRKNSSINNLAKLAPTLSYVLDLFPNLASGHDLADAIIIKENKKIDISEGILIKEYIKPKKNNRFWQVKSTKKETYLIITKPDIVKFLEDEGFCHILVSDSEKTQTHELVLKQNNICSYRQRKGVIDYVETFVNNLPKGVLEIVDGLEITKELIMETVLQYGNDIFAQANIDMIQTLNLNFLADEQRVSYKFYKNCIVKITTDDFKILAYSELKSCIWKNQILNRNFKALKERDYADSIFNQFLTATQLDEKDNSKLLEKVDNLLLCVGYLLHSYKSSFLNKIIFAIDSSLLEDEQGGNGKSMVFKHALQHMMPIAYIDGKNWKKDAAFPFQLLESYHKAIVVNDLARDFDLEKVFNVATDDMVVEKKHQGAYVVPFKNSPKMVLTGNLPQTGTTNAHARRLQIVEFGGHYNRQNTPFMEFGKEFWEDFTELEWLEFDNIMLDALQKWLGSLKFSEYVGKYQDKQLIAAVPEEIRDFFDKMLLDGQSGVAVGIFSKEDLQRDFNDLVITKSDKNYAKSGAMTKILKKYMQIKKIKPKEYTEKRYPYVMKSQNKEMLVL